MLTSPSMNRSTTPGSRTTRGCGSCGWRRRRSAPRGGRSSWRGGAGGGGQLGGGGEGVLVPGGFGMGGVEGKIEAIRYARTRGIPFFGICLGMQCATVEFARSVLGLADANSTEFDKSTQNPVISLMEDQSSVRQRGG